MKNRRLVFITACNIATVIAILIIVYLIQPKPRPIEKPVMIQDSAYVNPDTLNFITNHSEITTETLKH